MTENKIVRDKMPLVSVVVPIYNVELYLKECVDSILSQTYKNIEVILVDDESPDLCGKICDDYAAMDGRIKVVHKKNGGLSDARNAGMKVATGDLITFVDSDDYISKDFVKILFEAMSENNSDIAIANMKRTSRRDDKNTVIDWKVSSYKNEDALIRMLYGTPFGTSACGKLFKRSLFTGVEFPYGKFSEDLFTIYKTILKSENVTYVGFDGYFYYYRDEGSIVVSGYKEKHLEALDAIDDIVRAVKGKTQFDNALSTQYINVVYDIAARNPQLSEFQNAEKKNAFICVIIAFLFHTSSLLILLIYLLYDYIVKGTTLSITGNNVSKRNETPRMLISMGIGFVVMIMMSAIVSALSAVGFGEYVSYVTGKLVFMPNQLLIRIPQIILIIWSYRYLRKDGEDISFFLVMEVYAVLFSQFTSVSGYGGRIALYFAIFEVLVISQAMSALKPRKSGIIIRPLIIGYYMFYWWYYFAFVGAHQTVPYIFMR